MKNILSVVVLSLCIFGTSPIVPAKTQAVSQVKSVVYNSTRDGVREIPIIGYMKDSHYPVYNVRGDSFGVWYISGNQIFTAMELPKYIDYIDQKDVKDYYCEITCIDKYKHVIGLNPKIKHELSPDS